MFTLSTIVSALGLLAANASTFTALGADVVGLFEKGKSLVGSDTASTPEERAAALAEIADLESQRDAALEALRQQVPNS